MKFSVQIKDVSNEKFIKFYVDSFNINERRPEPYVFKSEIMKAIKASHLNIHSVQIFGCDVNVWSDD